VTDLLEYVVVIDHGRVVMNAPVDEVRGHAFTVNGLTSAVDEFVVGRTVLPVEPLRPVRRW
jgi:ABC-2 type transport system ATP-binding protein